MQNYFLRFTFLTFFLFLLANLSIAQDKKFPAPREEKLLNGLNVLIWRQPNTGRVSVKLRIHSGSAFDPKDKEGTMALLSDIFFPDSALKKYFEEDLQGKLEVISTYDYIQINAEAKSDEFLTVLETISSAVTAPQIDKKILEKIKSERLQMLEKLEKDPNYIADRAVAERLYGDFPYGKSQKGTTESLKKIDFADLIFSKQRFLTADNATLTITGDVKSNYAYRAARRLFGVWQKSLKKIPANFRVPEEPETTPLTVNVDDENVLEVRYALESTSKKDQDFYATEILTEILKERFKKVSTQNGLKNTFVQNNSNLLRGYITFGKSFNLSELPDSLPKEENLEDYSFIKKILTEKISQGEFESAKSKVKSSFHKMDSSDWWLEAATYKMNSVSDELNKFNKISIEDVQQIGMSLSKNKIVDVKVSSVKSEVKIEPKIPTKRLEEDPNK